MTISSCFQIPPDSMNSFLFMVEKSIVYIFHIFLSTPLGWTPLANVNSAAMNTDALVSL